MMSMTSRVPGSGRYSKREREQRWVLNRLPTGVVDPVEIRDLYLRDTQLRLRKIESPEEVIWKLGQKIRLRPESPEIVKMTNVYLDEHEYQVLLKLEGAQLLKTRWHWTWEHRRLSVDVFGGHLKGLVLAEIELDSDESLLGLPNGALVDVTRDDRFSGGALAWLTPGDATRLLDELLN
jgi:CYTH domain-containing protein